MPIEVIRRTVEPGVTLIEIRGRVTLGLDTRRLEDTVGQLEREGVTRLVMDVSGVDYMDSAGLGVLMRCLAVMRKTGGAFHLAGVRNKLRQLLRVTRLESMIPTYDTAERACAAFGKESSG